MICDFCGIDIPASFVKLIEANTCPSHDGPILSESRKQLMDEIKTAMATMESNDWAGLSGWLLSNYQLSKIGTGEPVQFYRGNSNQHIQSQNYSDQNNFQNQSPSGLKIAPNKTQAMLKRAGADKFTGPNKYRELTQAIQDGTVDQIYGTGQPLIKDLDQDFSQLDQAEQEAVMNRSNFSSQAKMIAQHSGELLGTEGEAPLNHTELQYLTNKVANLQNPELNTSLGQQALEENRLARLAKQQKMSMGGGAFTRG